MDGRQSESYVRSALTLCYKINSSLIVASPIRRIMMYISVISSQGFAFLDTKSQAEL